MNARTTQLRPSPIRRVLTMFAAAAVALTGAVVAQTSLATPAQAAETTYTHADGATITYDTEASVGEPIHVSGTNWLAKPDMVDEGEEGSVVGFKLIDNAIGQLSTTDTLYNPRLGSEVTNKTVWGTVWAESDGSFEIDLPWPDATTAAQDPVWEPGDSFTLQLLSGTMYSDEAGVDPSQRPDVSRTIPLTITVADDAPSGTAPSIAEDAAPGGTVGAAYEFTVPGSGDPAPTYSVTAGSLPAGLELEASSGLISGTPTAAGSSSFTVRAANDVDPAATREYTIEIAEAPVQAAPEITQQPEHVSTASGTSVSFTAAASGQPAPTVQWQRSTAFGATNPPATWTNIAGATDPTLTVAAGTSPHLNNRWYRAVFTNSVGTATSNPVKLTIAPAPAITQHPNTVGQTINVGETASFSAAATSGLEMTVQWQSTRTALPNGEPDPNSWAPVAGANDLTLSIQGTDAASQHGTFYRAAFTNASGTVYSYPAELRFFDRLDTEAEVTVSGESYGPVQPNTPFSVKAPNALVEGQPIVIEGTGYLATDGTTGSVANFMVDASYSGDPNTLNSSRDIINPVTGGVFADKRSHGIVQANADGTWRMEIPWPTAENISRFTKCAVEQDPCPAGQTVPDLERNQQFLDTNWTPGTQHIVRILTGSLLTSPADYQRGISVRFTVVEEPTAEPGVAPTITTQPAHTMVETGENASFTAAASGEPAATVQWQSSSDGGTTWVDLDGATDATLTLSAVTQDQTALQYRAVFANASGTATSNPAVLTVTPEQDPAFTYTLAVSNGIPAGVLITPKQVEVGEPITVSGSGFFLKDRSGGAGGPIFLNQPSGGTGPVNVAGRTIENQIPGSSFSDPRAHGVFQSDASGNWTLTFPFPTPDNSTLTEETAWQAGQTQNFRILTGSLVPNDWPRNTTASFELVAGEPVAVAPVVTTQPGSASVEAGENASFTAAASGDPEPTVQWESSTDGTSWAPIAGATSATLTLSDVAASLNGTQYRAVFTNAAGSATSDAATLTVTEPEPQDPTLLYTPVLSGGQPAGTLITPKEVVIGEQITISGTGWLVADGSEGSGGPVFINQPSGGTGPVTVVGRTIENQIPGSTYSDARAHGAWKADENGDWTITIPFPTPANSSLTEETAWQVGQEQTIRILTGSLVSGDRARTVSVPFTIVGEDGPEPVAPAVTTQPADASVEAGQDATFTAAASGEPAPTVQWQSSTDGIVWAPVAGATSTTLTLSNVAVSQNGAQYRAVFTNSEGTVTTDAATLTVTGPEVPAGEIALTNSTVEQHGDVWFNLSNFDEGTNVRVELVNGAGEAVASKPFTIGADGNTADPDGQTYRKVTVPRDAAPGGDYAVRVVNTADDEVLATSDSLTVTAATTRVFNPGDHAGGAEDLLVQRGGTWTFHAVGFAPDGKLTATAEVDGETVTLSGLGQISADEKAWQLDANGDTEREPVFTRVQIPTGIQPGEFAVTFTDGEHTVTRTLTIEPPETASVAVAETAELGGTIRVTGEGFMHPNGTEGSTIAIKINDGAYSRVDSSTHVNQTIWWIVEADEFGNFEIDMPVPNGTTADDADADTFGSTPALVPGEGFTLRFLTGSLKAGDLSRTLQSTVFSVTAPAPVEVAPAITAQPASQTVVAGQGASFTAAASGDPAPTVQWESSTDGTAWTPVAGATEATLILGTTAVSHSGMQYRAVFTNTAGSATTEAAILTVRPQASVTVAASAELGGTIRVTGEGFFHPTSTEQGSRIGIKIDEGAVSRLDTNVHANKTIWAIVNAELDGTFEVDLQLPDGTVAGSNGSDPAFTAGSHTLRLLTGSLLAGDVSRTLLTDAFAVTAPEPTEIAPAITAQPANASAIEGENATFTAAASGTPVPTVQWESSTDGTAWQPIGGATSSTLTLADVTLAQNGTQVRAVFTNAAGTATTQAATLEVTPAKPTTTPAPPAADDEQLQQLLDELGEENNDAEIDQIDGTTARITIDGASEGEWFFVYGYSAPTPLGWHQADANGSFLVDLTRLGEGTHTLVVLDDAGALRGWGIVTLADGTTQPGTKPGERGLVNSGAAAPMGLAALAAALLLGAVAVGIEGRRRAARRNTR